MVRPEETSRPICNMAIEANNKRENRKHIFAIALVVFLSLVLFGCSSNSSSTASSLPASSTNGSSVQEDDSASLPPANNEGNESATEEDESVSSSSAVDEIKENIVEEEWLTLDQMNESNHFYVFIQKGDLFNPIAADNTYERNTLLVDYKSNEDDPDNIIPVVDSSAERLALSNYRPQKDTFAFFPITRTAYYGSYPNEIYSCEEIDGKDVNSLEGESIQEKIANYMHSIGIETPFLEDLPSRITPVSETPTEFTIGYYQGTKWVESTIWVKTEGFDINSNNSIELPIEKTKDGYFYVDISSLNPGKYAIANGNAWHSQVNDYSVIEIA